MNKLENISVKKLLVQLIIPSLVTAIVSGSYNLVDGIFIGQTLGLEGNSANTYTLPASISTSLKYCLIFFSLKT